jgi:hypothetical protein
MDRARNGEIAEIGCCFIFNAVQVLTEAFYHNHNFNHKMSYNIIL